MTNADSDSTTVRLRTATLDDAATLTAVGARLFADTFGPDNSPEDMQTYLAEAFTPARQAAELAEPDRMTWLLENSRGTMGYAVLIRDSSIDLVHGNRPSELRRIYVDRSLQGRSGDPSGRNPSALLLDQCVSQARAWQCDVLWLAVWERNPRAIRFYEKNGFERVGQKSFQLGSDLQHDFVMARNL